MYRLRTFLNWPAIRSYSTKSELDFEKLTQQLLKPDFPARDQTVDKKAEPLEGWGDLTDAEESDESEMPMVAPMRTEQKEELIFKEVLGQVLSSNTRPHKNTSTSQPLKKSTPLSDSILALFDKPDTSRPRNQPQSVQNDNYRNNSPSIASLMDGLLQPPESQNLSPEEIKKNEAVAKLVEPVAKFIDSLETNADVTAYFEKTILPRFDASIKTEPTETVVVNPLEPIVSSDTVSHILEKCITVLAQDFRDQLGAIHLFEMAKHHSIEFFTEACSAEVYNQIIRIRWEDYRDLYSVVSLASEISINAIQPTLETTELLSKIYRDAMDGSKGISSSKLGMPLWTGQDMKRLDELNRYRMRFQSSWASKPILRI